MCRLSEPDQNQKYFIDTWEAKKQVICKKYILTKSLWASRGIIFFFAI